MRGKCSGGGKIGGMEEGKKERLSEAGRGLRDILSEKDGRKIDPPAKRMSSLLALAPELILKRHSDALAPDPVTVLSGRARVIFDDDND